MTLRVKLEIVPFGDEDKAYEIGRLDIFNKGPINGDRDLCCYGVINLTPGNEGLYEESIIHRRSAGAWELVYSALLDCDVDGPYSSIAAIEELKIGEKK